MSRSICKPQLKRTSRHGSSVLCRMVRSSLSTGFGEYTGYQSEAMTGRALISSENMRGYMANHEHSVELAGVNLAGRNHVCAFFNTLAAWHRVLGSFSKAGHERSGNAS